MQKLKVAMLFAMGLVAGCVDAQTDVDATIRKSVEPRLGKKIDEVRPSPYPGLYEVRIGNELAYASKDGQFLVLGELYSMADGQNLTRARLDELNRIDFKQLPLGLALKTVKGNGKRVLAIFEDPNCGYCKRFRQTTLREVDNVTIYTFLYNILSADSVTKSTNVWCAPDRNRAWDEWMLQGKLPPPAPANCKAPIEKVLELGRRYNIQGTPAIFFTDGSRIPGAVDLKTIEAKFATLKD